MEAWLGEGADSAVVLAIGTGIGGGVVLADRLQVGHLGLLGEVGHMVVDPAGPPCGCGQAGCWEVLASGLFLDTLGSAALGTGSTGRDLVAAAREHRSAADSALLTSGGNLILVIRNRSEPVRSEGHRAWRGVMESDDVLIPLISNTIGRMSKGPRPSWPEVRVVALRNRAGAVGAALLPEHSAST